MFNCLYFDHESEQGVPINIYFSHSQLAIEWLTSQSPHSPMTHLLTQL